MTLDEHLCNQTVDNLKTVAIRMGINRDAVNAKSKGDVKKIIETVQKYVLEDADKSEQDKKTYLIGIINEVTTIMPKSDTKQHNTPKQNEHKDDDEDPDVRIKKSTKIVNDWDKESSIQGGEAVADDDQEGESKMNILWEQGVLKKMSLLRKKFRVNGSIVETGQKKTHVCVPYARNK